MLSTRPKSTGPKRSIDAIHFWDTLFNNDVSIVSFLLLSTVWAPRKTGGIPHPKLPIPMPVHSLPGRLANLHRNDQICGQERNEQQSQRNQSSLRKHSQANNPRCAGLYKTEIVLPPTNKRHWLFCRHKLRTTMNRGLFFARRARGLWARNFYKVVLASVVTLHAHSGNKWIFLVRPVKGMMDNNHSCNQYL